MATLPLQPPQTRRRREPLTGARLIIVSVAVGFALFLLWAMLAQVDEVTKGQGKVIPSSKIQIIQSSTPATIDELLVRSGQRVSKGQLLARLDNPESRSIEAETEALQARSAGPQAEGTGASASLQGEEATLSAVRHQALSSRVAALRSSAEQRRREGAEAAATISSLSRSLVLAQDNVDRLAPLAAKNIVPQTELA